MHRNMASGRDYRALFLLMVLLLPSIHSARLLEEVEAPAAATAASPSQSFSGEELLQVEGDGGGGAPASVSMGVSERVVPTGPDPLHHNHSPAIRRSKP